MFFELSENMSFRISELGVEYLENTCVFASNLLGILQLSTENNSFLITALYIVTQKVFEFSQALLLTTSSIVRPVCLKQIYCLNVWTIR